MVLVVVDPEAAAQRGPAIPGRHPDDAKARRHVVLVRHRRLQRRRAAEPRDDTLVVRIDVGVDGRRCEVEIVACAEVQRDVVGHLPRVLRVRRRIPDRRIGLPRPDVPAEAGRVARRIVDVERPVLRDPPTALVRRFDVHVHLLARDDPAELELVTAADQREVVDDEQIPLAFETREGRRAEIGARIADSRELARRVAGRGVVPRSGEQLRPAEPAGQVAQNPRLVHAVGHKQLVERRVAQGCCPVAEDVPQGTAEGLARLERLERGRGSWRGTAHVQVAPVRVRVAEVCPVLLVHVHVDLADADRLLLAGGDDRRRDGLPPVIRDPEHIGRCEVQPLDSGEVEHLVFHDRTAEETSPPLLIERRRRIQEDRLPARVVPAGERRAVEPVVAEEPVTASIHRVGAAARDHVQNAAGGLPVFRAERVGEDLEFLDPVLGKVVRLTAVELHLVRRAVDDDAVGEGPLAGDRHAGALARTRRVRRRRAGRERRERAEIARDGRQIVDLFVGDDRRQRALRLDRHTLRDDVNRLGHASDLHREVDGQVLADAQHEVLLGWREARQLGSQFVRAGPEVREKILPLAAGDRALHRVGLDLAHRHGHAGQRATLLIEHGAAQRPQSGLGHGWR